MKTTRILLILNLLVVCFGLTGCRRNSNDVWEDTKSASRHMNRGVRTLGGKHGDSRAVQNRDDFYASDFNGGLNPNGSGGQDFIPMGDFAGNGNEIAMGEPINPQPRESPGEPGSSIPGIEAFRDPSTIPGLSGIYRNVHFEYNSNLVKGQENLDTIHNIADHMRRNPNTYIFVEGHCDERGPEAFNLALGARRSNAVRNTLIAEGVSPDNIFTISYGKERPLFYDHNEESWMQNRRAEFKVYQR